jgi:hypothetical protein
MSIKNISALTDKSPYYINKFLTNCTIEEKIDTHYMYFTIEGKDKLKFYKANNKEISRVDLIINSMWNQFILDWTYIMYKNSKWFNAHIGYTFYMFYLPNNKPLSTTYNIDRPTYILDRILYKGKMQSVKDTINDLIIDSPTYSIHIKKYIKKNKLKFNIDNNTSKDVIINICKDLISYNNILAVDNKPEGFIYRWNNYTYQDILYTIDKPHIDTERTSYEFVLCDFLKFLKSINYMEYVTSKYVKTVCNLFNMYIINSESVTNTVSKNVNIDALDPPIYGHSFDMTTTYIPDAITRQFVENNELYSKIFKILLVNLSKRKYLKHCIYMNKQQVDQWNALVGYLELVTKYE